MDDIDIDAADVIWAEQLLAGGEPVCRVCGCTDERACDGGCIWAEADLCSRCARAA
jgi:hypothetical protein